MATEKRPQINIRDEDGALRDMLEDIRAAERPVPSNADVIRRLVREEWERLRRKQKRA